MSGLQNFSGQMAAARRLPLVDEEAQTVLAYAVFIRRPGLGDAAERFCRVVFHRRREDSYVYAAMFYPSHRISPFPIGRPTTATGPCREVSCLQQRRRNKGDS